MLIWDLVNPDERLTQFMIKPKSRLERYLTKLYSYKKQPKRLFLPPIEQNQKINQKSSRDFDRPILIFSCELGQSFSIGEDIQFIVLGNTNGVVRIGIEAPIDIHIKKIEL